MARRRRGLQPRVGLRLPTRPEQRVLPQAELRDLKLPARLHRSSGHRIRAGASPIVAAEHLERAPPQRLGST